MFDFIDRCRGDMSLYAKWREDDRSDYIYLDGTDGDDANDGTTEESAVKTFERAKSLLAESKQKSIEILDILLNILWGQSVLYHEDWY